MNGWLIPLIILGMGILFIGIGLIGLAISLKKQSRNQMQLVEHQLLSISLVEGQISHQVSFCLSDKTTSELYVSFPTLNLSIRKSIEEAREQKTQRKDQQQTKVSLVYEDIGLK